jgi:hypothetical protein
LASNSGAGEVDLDVPVDFLVSFCCFFFCCYFLEESYPSISSSSLNFLFKDLLLDVVSEANEAFLKS